MKRRRNVKDIFTVLEVMRDQDENAKKGFPCETSKHLKYTHHAMRR